MASSYREENRVEWFLQRVVTPQPNDVLVTMVNENNHNANHHGNRKPSFRILPASSHPRNTYFHGILKNVYFCTGTAVMDPKTARDLVYAIYHQSPPGRFLVQSNGEAEYRSWRNIGVEEAVEATQQAWLELSRGPPNPFITTGIVPMHTGGASMDDANVTYGATTCWPHAATSLPRRVSMEGKRYIEDHHYLDNNSVCHDGQPAFPKRQKITHASSASISSS